VKKIIQLVLLFLFCALILGFSIRGIAGNPTSDLINQPKWKDNGPLELSPERGRFALTYSLIEDKSFQFSNNIGIFAKPDVAVYNGRFVSLFAPLLSFIIIPGYVVGKYFGVAQVGAFGVISIFALLNVILLRLIAIRLGAGKLPATIASLIFLFATPAFPYAVTLYQHHISTFLILLSIYALLKSNRILVLLIVFFLCALAIPLDYPNLFFMFPIGLFTLGRIFYLKKENSRALFKLNIIKLLTIFIMIIPILFFMLFNKASYDNPFQLSGTIESSKSLHTPGDLASLSTIQTYKKQKEATKKTAIGFFDTRNLLNGLYIHFISPDRGVIYYAPVILFGIAGILLAYRRKVQVFSLLVSIIGANILLYSLWGDPWGGWAFGSRYLIPSYAILSIFIALLLTYWSKKILFLIMFLVVAFYSIAVNTLGAITTSALPPQVQVLELEKISGIVQKYTYSRNWDFLTSGQSKSFVYQTFLSSHLSPVVFYQILTVSICIVVGGMTLYYYLISRKGEGNV